MKELAQGARQPQALTSSPAPSAAATVRGEMNGFLVGDFPIALLLALGMVLPGDAAAASRRGCCCFWGDLIAESRIKPHSFKAAAASSVSTTAAHIGDAGNVPDAVAAAVETAVFTTPHF